MLASLRTSGTYQNTAIASIALAKNQQAHEKDKDGKSVLEMCAPPVSLLVTLPACLFFFFFRNGSDFFSGIQNGAGVTPRFVPALSPSVAVAVVFFFRPPGMLSVFRHTLPGSVVPHHGSQPVASSCLSYRRVYKHLCKTNCTSHRRSLYLCGARRRSAHTKLHFSAPRGLTFRATTDLTCVAILFQPPIWHHRFNQEGPRTVVYPIFHRVSQVNVFGSFLLWCPCFEVASILVHIIQRVVQLFAWFASGVLQQ